MEKQQLDSFIHSTEVTNAALSLNGRLLATVTSNGEMHLWCTHSKVLRGSMYIPALSLGPGVRCIGLYFAHNDSALICVSSCFLLHFGKDFGAVLASQWSPGGAQIAVLRPLGGV